MTLLVYVEAPSVRLARAEGAHRYAIHLIGKSAEPGDWPRSRARALAVAACEHLEIAVRLLGSLGGYAA